jgi:hypothetical protein
VEQQWNNSGTTVEQQWNNSGTTVEQQGLAYRLDEVEVLRALHRRQRHLIVGWLTLGGLLVDHVGRHRHRRFVESERVGIQICVHVSFEELLTMFEN